MRHRMSMFVSTGFGAAMLLATLTVAGCAGSAGGPTPGGSGTGVLVTGTVTAAPGCPGPERVDSPCPARPVVGGRVELSAGSRVVATATTDATGRFRVVVPAGQYRITAYNLGNLSQASQDLTVTGPVDVALVVDSGMR
jgi:carboxypeptidase family protein